MKKEMKKEQPKLQVIVHGELDLQNMPEDIMNALITALVDNINKLMEEDSKNTQSNG